MSERAERGGRNQEIPPASRGPAPAWPMAARGHHGADRPLAGHGALFLELFPLPLVPVGLALSAALLVRHDERSFSPHCAVAPADSPQVAFLVQYY